MRKLFSEHYYVSFLKAYYSALGNNEYYENYMSYAMTMKIRGIEAFKGFASPMKRIEENWISVLNYDIFTADFSYGLKVIKDLCELFAVEVGNILKIWNWYPEYFNRKC